MTWSVDGVELARESLARGEGLVLGLVWGERNLTQGDTLMVTCSALAGWVWQCSYTGQLLQLQ